MNEGKIDTNIPIEMKPRLRFYTDYVKSFAQTSKQQIQTPKTIPLWTFFKSILISTE